MDGKQWIHGLYMLYYGSRSLIVAKFIPWEVYLSPILGTHRLFAVHGPVLATPISLRNESPNIDIRDPWATYHAMQLRYWIKPCGRRQLVVNELAVIPFRQEMEIRSTIVYGAGHKTGSFSQKELNDGRNLPGICSSS